MASRLYTEEELLRLSGIQHFSYCPRQWALIEIEQVWEDNHLTSLGQVLHQKVNKPEETERRRDVIILRSVPLASYTLGLYGVSDAVELHATEIQLGNFVHPKYPGHWQLIPIEYKRGRPKKHNADKVQLCAEAISLEEMYEVDIPVGYIYYGETKHREEIKLTNTLREETQNIADKMHEVFINRDLPPVLYNSGCRSCSLIEHCMPHLSNLGSVDSYYQRHNLFKI